MLRGSMFLLLGYLVVLIEVGHTTSATVTKPAVVLQGVVHSSQARTYFQRPFQLLPNVHRISVEFKNLGKKDGTALDLGIADPSRFRGASGSNKHFLTISDPDATPSYLPGAIQPGDGGC